MQCRGPRIMVVARRRENRAFHDVRRELRRHNLTFHHLYEALMTLEPELARHAAIRTDADDLRELHELIDRQERNLDDLREWSRLDTEFHLAIAEVRANPALIIAREPVNQLLLPTLYRFMDSREMAAHATRYHRRIAAEIEVHDADTAASVTRRHTSTLAHRMGEAGPRLSPGDPRPRCPPGAPESARQRRVSTKPSPKPAETPRPEILSAR